LILFKNKALKFELVGFFFYVLKLCCTNFLKK